MQCSPEREAVTLLRATTSHSNSRDSVGPTNQSSQAATATATDHYIQASGTAASSQHTLRYPSASVLTTTPTNAPTLPL